MPKVATLAAAAIAVAALIVVLANRSDDKGDTAGSGGGEVFLQNKSVPGPDPFTAPTTGKESSSEVPSVPPRTGATQGTTPTYSGSTAGLYGGTQDVASCNVEQQVRYLTAEPDKNAAFASALGIQANQVPAYLRSLTPLLLRADTRVTNHSYKNGTATAYQATLQAGTAVLVDDKGMPRVRCACGNPLKAPVAQQNPKTTGTPWQGYNASQVVVVVPSVTVVNVFVVYDAERDSWFARKHGDTGRHDKPTPPPPRPTPTTTSPSTSSTSPSVTPTSPTPCVTDAGDGTQSPCPSTLSPTQTTPTPSTETPSTDTTSPSPETPTDSPSDSPSDSPDASPDGGTTDDTATATTDDTTTTDGTTDSTTDSTTGGTEGPASSSASSGLQPVV
ncbi:DUF6777 domain-containing protein [Streptomyces sp. NPDC047974]|uniref:DUF6777 domain-containing protein n=1 Tax=Streptomyces sp. NPDC047974 TaxID=3154343 RepID=UPI0033E5B304